MKIRLLFGLVVVLLALSCRAKSSGFLEETEYIPVKLEGSNNWSLMDKEGNLICLNEIKNEPSAVTEGMFFVEEDEVYSLYRVGNKPDAVTGYQELKEHGYFNHGYCLVTLLGQRISLINKNGEKVTTLGPIDGHEVVEASNYLGEGLIRARLDNGSYGYLTLDGKTAIDFDYSDAFDFSEGLAIVQKGNQPMVINTEGEVLFEINEDIWITYGQFINGHICGYHKPDNCMVIIDTVGNITKCPDSVGNIDGFVYKYYPFVSKDRKWGLIDPSNANIVIEPQYNWIQYIGDGKLLLCNESICKIVNIDGEEICQFEGYDKAIIPATGFGLLGVKNDTYLRIDQEGNALDNNKFSSIYPFDPFVGNIVHSDYFSYENLANNIASYINDKGVNKYIFGGIPSEILDELSPFIDGNSERISDFVWGRLYDISYQLIFDNDITKITNTNERIWNDNCYLRMVYLEVNGKPIIAKTGLQAIKNALINKGFVIEKQCNEESHKQAVALSYNNIMVLLKSTDDPTDNTVKVIVFENTEENRSCAFDVVDNASAEDPIIFVDYGEIYTPYIYMDK